MFYNKTKLFTRKNILKVSLLQIFLLVQTPVKLRNSQIYKNFQLWYNFLPLSFRDRWFEKYFQSTRIQLLLQGGRKASEENLYSYIYCPLMYHCKKIWWYWLLFPNYVFKQDKMFYIKGNAKYFHCCYLTFLVLFVFLSFHFSMFFFWPFSFFLQCFLHPPPNQEGHGS